MRIHHFARKKRQLKSLSGILEQKLKIGEGRSSEVVLNLVAKVRTLLLELTAWVSKAELRLLMGATAALFGLMFGSNLNAQNFASPVLNPFNIASDSLITAPELVDLDNDGDFDLVVREINYYYSSNLVYFENTGSKTNPLFGAPTSNPFGIDTFAYFAISTFADIDGDGDQDMLVGQFYGPVLYFQNIGTPAIPQFDTAIADPFGFVSSVYNNSPTFVDLDDDGDFDVLVGEYYGNMRFYENTGTASNPQFGAGVNNPFGLDTVNYFAMPDFGDLDNDGDLDLMVGTEYGLNLYFENTGSSTSPQFAAPIENPFGLDSLIYISIPHFVDIDNDGDLDLFIGTYDSAIYYYENIPVNVGLPSFHNAELSIYPNPTNGVVLVESDVAISQLEIYDASSRLLGSIIEPNNEISVKQLAAGIYYLKFYIEEEIIVQKLIRQ